MLGSEVVADQVIAIRLWRGFQEVECLRGGIKDELLAQETMRLAVTADGGDFRRHGFTAGGIHSDNFSRLRIQS